MVTTIATPKSKSRTGPRLSVTLAMLWRSFCRDTFDPYRPELHYMRGPGPKWRAKYGLAATVPAEPASPTPAHATPAAA
jgi:hypothetical protein